MRLSQALAQKNLSKSIDLARKLQSKAASADVGLAVEAQAQRDSGFKEIEAKRWEGLAKRAARLRVIAQKIRADYPVSAYLNESNEWLAVADWFDGMLEQSRKKWLPSQKAFTRGLSRVASARVLWLMPMMLVKAFSRACSAKLNEDCVYWIRRLYSYYPKESVEAISIREDFDKAVLETTISAPVLGPRLTQRYPAPDEDQAPFDEALQLALKGEVKDSIEKFEEFIAKYPRSQHRTRALYWLGLSRILREDFDEAKPHLEEIAIKHPLSYYGLLSLMGLKGDPEKAISRDVPRLSLEDPLADPAELDKIRKAERYANSGAPELAYLEIKDFTFRRNHSNEFLFGVAELATRSQASLTAFRVMAELVQRQAQGTHSSTAFEIYYPLLYWNLIQKYAKENALDPILVLSLVKQESSFVASIASGAGAVGLMQLMPFTAVHVDPKIEQFTLTDPDTSIRLGTKYLAELVRRFDGNWALALAGYNAGPSRADRWLREGNPKWGLFQFVEAIPYRETRDYVSSIMRNYYWYTWKLKRSKLDSLDVFWRKELKLITSKPEETPTPEEPPKLSETPQEKE